MGTPTEANKGLNFGVRFAFDSGRCTGYAWGMGELQPWEGELSWNPLCWSYGLEGKAGNTGAELRAWSLWPLGPVGGSSVGRPFDCQKQWNKYGYFVGTGSRLFFGVSLSVGLEQDRHGASSGCCFGRLQQPGRLPLPHISGPGVFGGLFPTSQASIGRFCSLWASS